MVRLEDVRDNGCELISQRTSSAVTYSRVRTLLQAYARILLLCKIVTIIKELIIVSKVELNVVLLLSKKLACTAKVSPTSASK